MFWLLRLFTMGSSLVGSKTGRIVVGVLVAILISYTMILFIQSQGKDKVTIEIQDQQIKKRKEIDKAIRSGDGTVDDSLQYLTDR